MANILRNCQKYFENTPKPRAFLTVYCIFTILGLSLSFLSVFLPFLTICLPFFGHTTCTSLGQYILVLLNLPGYIIAALVLPDAETIAELYSLIIVGSISIIFYYFLGRFFEMKRGRSSSPTIWIIRILVASTLVLFLLFVYLLFRIRM